MQAHRDTRDPCAEVLSKSASAELGATSRAYLVVQRSAHRSPNTHLPRQAA